MDHELKQRLIGAIVVTALAAIFIPMLFDDPIDNSGQQVSELTIPKAPENLAQKAEKKLPEDFGRALTPSDQDATGGQNDGADSTAAGEESDQPVQTESPVDDELVATEADNEEATPNGSAASKAPAETLDTGEVSESEKSNDVEPIPAKVKPAAEPKVSGAVTEPKIKKKPKAAETDSHKTASNSESSVVDNTSHKAKLPSSKTGGLSRWSIQAGSFSKKENAVAMLEKLQKQGFPVTLQSKGNIYRLKIGPELDKQRAADMKKRLDKQNIQAFIIAE